MNENQPLSRPLQIVAWTIVLLVVAGITGLFLVQQSRKSNLPVYGEVGNFTLTNQLGETVAAADLKGKVWVADIIFSRCAGPCPKMTEQMALIQEAFNEAESLRLVTLTTDPEFDTPPVLAKYGSKFGADADRWWFLTGSKDQIRRLGIEGLKLTAIEKEESQQENEADLFIHSTIFVLVDSEGRLRGIYESLEPGFQEKIANDIRALLQEA